MVLVLATLGKVSTGGTPSTLAYVIKLLLGLLFLFSIQLPDQEKEQLALPHGIQTTSAPLYALPRELQGKNKMAAHQVQQSYGC